MRPYTQLTQEQRYQIYPFMQTQQTQSALGELLGVHKSTISREVRRNRGQRGYRPQQAYDLAVKRQLAKVRSCIDGGAWRRIDIRLKEEWSPEQISGWLKREHPAPVSPEWI